jgi:anti-sigma B factor antagonist
MEFYYHDVDEDVLILNADGGLAAFNADEFVGELEKAVDLGCRKLIVDCSRLNYISSYGLGVLIRLHKKLASKGGDVKLANVGGAIPRLLEMVRLDRIFAMYPTLEDARRAFQEQKNTQT